MLSPSLTDVLRRRIFALLIDLGLVGLVAGFVARTQLESFTPTEFDGVTGDPIYSAADFDRLNELRGQFNRLMPWGGDTVNVIGQTGFILLAFVTALTALLVFILLPANGGWSPGQKLLGLRTVDPSGDDVGLGTHAVRTIVGIVDGFPWILPGLLGWVLARGDVHHRRLGDRLAKTLVIDAKEPITFVDSATLEAREQRRQRRKEAQDASPTGDLDSMVDLDNRLLPGDTPPPPTGVPLSTPDVETAPAFDAAPTFDAAPDVDPGFGLAAEAPAVDTSFDTPDLGIAAPGTPAAFDPIGQPEPVAEAAPTFGEALGSIHETPAPLLDDSITPDPEVEVTVGDSTPPFAVDLGIEEAESSAVWEQPAVAPTEAAAPRTRARAPRPQHRTPPQHRSGAATPAAEVETAPVADATVIEAAPATTDPTPEPVEYESPVATTAPVWTPGSAAAPAEADFSTEPSPSVAAAATDAAGGPSPDPDDVVWNDQWQAWLYWDPKAQRWLRHEPQRNVWIPIS